VAAAERRAALDVIVDEPSHGNGLGFREYAEALSDAIRGGQPRFTVGIYGPWGSGKSTLLRAIAAQLSEHDDVITVQFDAWRHERSEYLIVPLLHQVHKQASEQERKVGEEVGRALKAIVASLNVRLPGVSLDTKSVRTWWREDRDRLPALDDAFSKPFAALRKISEALGDNRRIVVLVDDLDRCSSDKVVSVLESINIMLDVPGLVFVLALDYDVLTAAIKEHRPHVEEPHVFVEKMVQLPFRVPPIDVRRNAFFEELVPDWRKHFAAYTELEGTLVEIADLALRRNPRQLKRVLNAFLVLRRIVDRKQLTVANELLIAILALQLRWPERYRTLQTELQAADVEGVDIFRGDREDDPEFERYRSRFLRDQSDEVVGRLRSIVGLTAVATAAPKAASHTADATPPVGVPDRLAIVLKDDSVQLSLGDRMAEAEHELNDDTLRLLEALDHDGHPSEYGQRLFAAIFASEHARSLWQEVRDGMRRRRQPVRVHLRIEASPRVVELRWEAVQDPDPPPLRISTSSLTPFSRRPPRTDTPLFAPTVGPGPLRLLVAGGRVPAEEIDEAAVELTVVSDLRSPADIHDGVRQLSPHVVVVMAPWRAGREPFLILQTEGDAHHIRPEDISVLIEGVETLGLVALFPTPDADSGPPAGVAHHLAGRTGISTLVVRDVLDTAALSRFTRSLIRALGAGEPLDAAVTAGREALFFAGMADTHAGDFTAPVLVSTVTTPLVDRPRTGVELPRIPARQPA
jgi:ABC-type dipeptide/oligopeptide/nickel transport system ATPase subunit